MGRKLNLGAVRDSVKVEKKEEPPKKGKQSGSNGISQMEGERSIIRGAWKKLEMEELRLREERFYLQDSWQKIIELNAIVDEGRHDFEAKCVPSFKDPDTRFKLNVGGQVFETTAGVLCRDRFSLLAWLCQANPPCKADKDGCIFIERDWWLFRHILAFLRSSVLPSHPALLQELYAESTFYRLSLLKRAIEAKSMESPPVSKDERHEDDFQFDANPGGMVDNYGDEGDTSYHHRPLLSDPNGFTNSGHRDRHHMR